MGSGAPAQDLNAVIEAFAEHQSGDGIPLHRRISSVIGELIKNGSLRPGTMLPPEVELARSFDVSRHTMRASLDALVRDGLIERRRGRGTVVLRPRIEQNLARFYSTAQEMRQRGARLSTRVLERGTLAPGEEFASQAADCLGLATPEQGGYVVRLRLVDEEPVFIETLTFPLEIAGWLLVPDASDPAAEGFYEQLAVREGLRVTHANERIRPDIVAGHEAQLLDVPDDTPVFVIERQSFVGEQCVEWRQTVARGDRYTFSVDLTNPDEDGVA